jgi:LuxR family maltose regulon positive regulatory protein
VAQGDRDAAERWAARAEPPAATAGESARGAIDAGLGVVRAAIARDGLTAMTVDARRAFAAAPDDATWRSFARLLEGSAHCVAGRTDEARACLDDGARRAVLDAPLVRSLCLAQLAFLSLQADDLDDAAALAAGARAAVVCGDDGELPLTALSLAVSALVLSHRGQLDAARRDIKEAGRRLAVLPDVAPWYGALARVALARAELRLSDGARARGLLSEASRLAARTPDAVALRTWIDDAWAQADDYAAGPVACPTVLTRAELRVLRLLPSHLSFREIAARLHVSANTIKTQAHAVYRKLDASSRSEAVANARAIGLVDG